MNSYYMAIEEWLYASESGREPVEVTFDSIEEAMDYAESKAENEVLAFAEHNKVDCLIPGRYEDCHGDSGGVILTCKNGLDPWYYACRVFKVDPIQ